MNGMKKPFFHSFKGPCRTRSCLKAQQPEFVEVRIKKLASAVSVHCKCSLLQAFLIFPAVKGIKNTNDKESKKDSMQTLQSLGM